MTRIFLFLTIVLISCEDFTPVSSMTHRSSMFDTDVLFEGEINYHEEQWIMMQEEKFAFKEYLDSLRMVENLSHFDSLLLY